MNLKENLAAIRACLDVNVSEVEINDLVEHGKRLASMIGLSAHCKAEARKDLEKARLVAIKALISDKVGPQLTLKMADATIYEELSNFEYADRLNAGITHQLDFYRSVMSLHKTELENSMKQ